MSLLFTLNATDGSTRAGTLHLRRGDVKTPVFMPVGTQGCVKSLDSNDLGNLGTKLILANTYHLYLRPTSRVVRELGGLHGFSRFPHNFLTDSGGFQAFSLKARANEQGVLFKSHIDGSPHVFTPSSVIDAQLDFNSDILMPLDDLIPLPNSIERIKESIYRTIRWAASSKQHHQERLNHLGTKGGILFAINQGGANQELRKECALRLVEIGFKGYAIGGLAVGESKEEMHETLETLHEELPTNAPRYLMGVGKPMDLIEGIYRGVDMFDCVLPTRNARNGEIFTKFGRFNIKRCGSKNSPLEEGCSCYTCSNYSAAYLSHLYRANETLYFRLSSIHNLHYYLRLMEGAREAIISGRFEEFRSNFYKNQIGTN